MNINQLLNNFRGTGPFLFAILPVIAATVAILGAAECARGDIGFWRACWRLAIPALALWSITAVVLVGLRPGEVMAPPAASELQLNPFHEIRQLDPAHPWDGGSLLLGNVWLFAPAGFFMALWKPRWRVWHIVLGGLALSFAIELCQLLIVKDRTAATDDLILNTVGVALGALTARGISRLWRRGDSNP